MPYIPHGIRNRVDPEIKLLVNKLSQELGASRAGMMNYVIFRIVSETVHGHGTHKWSYFEITEAVAAFECAKLEFYRRVAAPKEDIAIDQWGDIPAYHD